MHNFRPSVRILPDATVSPKRNGADKRLSIK